MRMRSGDTRMHEPNHRHPRLLRACCERPRSRAAEERDELAALHSITSSASASSLSGIWRPSAGGLPVDHQLEFGWLHDRQIGGLLAFENARGIEANLPVHVGNIDAVAHQTAIYGIFASCVHRGHRVARRQGHNLVTARREERESSYPARCDAL